MGKYSEIEIQTAKKLHDAGYKWITRYQNGDVGAFSENPNKKGIFWLGTGSAKIVPVSGRFTPIFQGIKWEDNEPTYIEDIINPQILDEVERHYLETVLKPLHKVEYIARRNISKNDFIRVYFADYWYMEFPPFKANTMYQGMKINKMYTPKELGLRGLRGEAATLI